MRLLPVPLCVWVGLTVVTDQVVLDFNEGQECKQLNGFSWICKKIRECPKAIADLELEIIADRCKPDDVKNPVVCCETQIPVIEEKNKEGDVCRSDNGTNWTCKKEEDCPEAQTFRPTYKIARMNSDIHFSCTSVGSGPKLVCCKPRTEDKKKENDVCRSDNGINWTCKKEEDCPEALIDPRNSDIHYPCKSDGSGTNLVCCKPRTEDKKKEKGRVCKEESGVIWTCEKLTECPKALEDINKGLNPQKCYPLGPDYVGKALVCCEPEVTPPVIMKKSTERRFWHSSTIST